MRKLSAVQMPPPVRMGSRDLRHRAPKEDLCLPTKMREPLFHFTRHTLNNSVSSMLALITLPNLPDQQRSELIRGILAEYSSLRKNLNSGSGQLSQMQAAAEMQEFFLRLQRRFVFTSETDAFESDEEKQAFSRLINTARVQLDKLLGILNGDPYRQFPEKVSLFRLIGDLMPNPAEGTKHHVYRYPETQPVFLYADRFDTALVLENFFSNAFRACERKGAFPFIEVSAFIQEENPKMAEITIRDKGIGFKTEELLLIRSRKGFTSKDSEGPDHGIGIQHCRFLIEQHGGILEISSREGDGTDIIFTMPASTA
ncbi:GHKL domain-containing protein [Candidatus Micrarchaeota archaeon]|nr:GHKL domain-containing protein [Candidatus Micrarchaeota archaeon]MBD3417800.1 GHKL domain-containing protein [Candidatus Micrarchaeota archaeon]